MIIDLEQKYKSLKFDQLAPAPYTLLTKTESADVKDQTLKTLSKDYKSQFATNRDRWHFVCKDLPSCNLFIDFDFYFMVSAALGRRCWLGAGDTFRLFPNLYIICISNPGLGKSLPAAAASSILGSLVDTKFDKQQNRIVETKLLHMGPDAITYEKLILRAAAATDSAKLADGRIYNHASTTFCLGDELGMLFSENTKKVVSFLMQSYDCRNFEGDTIKHGIKIIKNICINFLGCTTPGIIADLIKTRVFDDGFTGRAIFLYSDKKRKHPATISTSVEQELEKDQIKKHLRKLAKLSPGEIKYTPEAQKWIDDWHEKKEDQKLNESPKLLDYYARKRIQLIKLAIAHAFSDQITSTIDVHNLVAAEKLLLAAEPDMHKALAGSSENPLSKLSESILQFLKEKGPSTRKRLILQFFSSAPDGAASINIALEYLVGTDQCLVCQVDKTDGYKANIKI